ncbi:MAG: putative DNA binding domain-containing protein [Clostridia bacterium]|nr:putative DNA binding domain-containing protein [Clostridia bacterium]
MLKEELFDLVNQIRTERCEGQRVELKSANGGCPRIYETLSSFSNQNDGGVIIFGISELDNYGIVGVYDPQDLLHKISEQCKQMHPEVRAATTSIEIDGKSVVAAEIPPVDVFQRPVYYKGTGVLKGSYIRVGDADEPMSEYEVYSYEAFKRHAKDDLRPCEGSTMEHLDESLLYQYLVNLRLERPNTRTLSNEKLLSLMGLVKEGVPTLASIMCFSNYPQALYPQLCITAVVVPGKTMGEITSNGQRFIDNKKIEGTIPQMVDGAVAFVAKNMKNGVRFDRQGKRIESPEYPLTAVREVVLNALVHRDYSVYTEGMPVRIEMYEDRLEVVNAGGLYGAIDIDELGRVHADTRNKGLVAALETINAVENRYSGIPTIRREMYELNLAEPKFIDKKGLFKVVLYNDRHINEKRVEVKSERAIIEFCEIPRSRKEISEFLGLSQHYALKTYVIPLIEKGLLEYEMSEKVQSSKQKIKTCKKA